MKGYSESGPTVRVTTDSPRYGKLNVWKILNCPQNVLKCNEIVHPAQLTCMVVISCVSGLTSFAIQQLFPIQILLLYFWYLNCCRISYFNATDLKCCSPTNIIPALFISGIHKVPGLNFKGGYRSRDQVLQRAKLLLTPKKTWKDQAHKYSKQNGQHFQGWLGKDLNVSKTISKAARQQSRHVYVMYTLKFRNILSYLKKYNCRHWHCLGL